MHVPEIARREMNAQKDYLVIKRVVRTLPKDSVGINLLETILRKEWVTTEKNCWYDQEGYIFLYKTHTVMKVELVSQ